MKPEDIADLALLEAVTGARSEVLARAMAVMIATSLFPATVARPASWAKVSKPKDQESIS